MSDATFDVKNHQPKFKIRTLLLREKERGEKNKEMKNVVGEGGKGVESPLLSQKKKADAKKITFRVSSFPRANRGGE